MSVKIHLGTKLKVVGDVPFWGILGYGMEKRKPMILTDDIEVFIVRDGGSIIQNW
jgi:hypothetical protein